MNRTAITSDLPALLAETARNFYLRGWMLGTSGNLSAVMTREPFRLAITASGVEKGSLQSKHILEVDESGRMTGGSGSPSAETPLHLAIIRSSRASAVLHTHSIWSTILSERHASNGGVAVEGYEMLKGLKGVSSHEHREWMPIIENSQDYGELTRSVEAILSRHPESHGFLLRRHGLYTWGVDLQEARRHVEILEFLLEVTGRIGADRPF